MQWKKTWKSSFLRNHTLCCSFLFLLYVIYIYECITFFKPPTILYILVQQLFSSFEVDYVILVFSEDWCNIWEEIKMHNGTMYHDTERTEPLKARHRHLLHLTCSDSGLGDTVSVTMSRGSQLLSSITESCSSCDDCGFLIFNTSTWTSRPMIQPCRWLITGSKP